MQNSIYRNIKSMCTSKIHLCFLSEVEFYFVMAINNFGPNDERIRVVISETVFQIVLFCQFYFLSTTTS